MQAHPTLKAYSVSVVIPTFKSTNSIPILLSELERVLSSHFSEFEVVVVDDCSPDNTWQMLKEKKASRPFLKIARLLRNSGQHNALLCGFSIATGDVVITMDDDLQNPPDEIPKLVQGIESGYSLVIGAYDSKKHTMGRNLGGSLIDSLLRSIYGLPEDFQLTSFRAMQKSLVRNVVSMRGVFPYITCMLLSHTSSFTNVAVEHRMRAFGETNYNLKRSLRLALNLIFSYSAYPMYATIVLCLFAMTVSAALGLFVLWSFLTADGTPPGWASTVFSISFFNGLVLSVLVVHNVYLMRLNQLVTQTRVSYTVDEFHG